MTAAIDREELLERIDGDLDFLAETVAMFREDAPGLLEAVRAGVAAGDADAVAKAAHTLKGMVSNFCAGPATEAALRLELMGKDADLATAGAALRDLEAQTKRLEQALDEMLG